jgi:sugar phosphate isomerase/epimerase
LAIRSSVTICLVPEARSGPFVFHDGLADGMARAAALGFDAVEIFPPGPEAIRVDEIRPLLKEHRLALSAVGTGAGWLRKKLTLTSPDPAIREQAEAFIGAMIESAGALSAPAIIGSMQGRWGDGRQQVGLVPV